MKLINSLFSPTPTNDLAAKRQQRALTHARTCLAEFDRERLVFGRFGTVEHQGETFRIVRGIVDEPRDSNATAFYVGQSRNPRWCPGTA